VLSELIGFANLYIYIYIFKTFITHKDENT